MRKSYVCHLLHICRVYIRSQNKILGLRAIVARIFESLFVHWRGRVQMFYVTDFRSGQMNGILFGNQLLRFILCEWYSPVLCLVAHSGYWCPNFNFELPAVNCHFVVDLCCIVHCKSSWCIRGLPVLFSICICTQWRGFSGMSEAWFTLQITDSITCH